MADARARLQDGLLRASALRGLPAHARAEPEAAAFDAVRGGLVAARKDEAVLDGFEEQQMADALELVAKRGTEKRMLRGRAIECLKSAFACPAWLRAAQTRPDLLASLRELLAETPELLAMLEAPVPASSPRHTEALLTFREASAYDKKPEVERLLTSGRDVMRQFEWHFPDDPLGTKLDEATAGFQSFFEGVTRLTTPTGKASVEVGIAELLQSFASEWPGILQFLVGVYNRRSVYRSRVKFVVVKLRELAPGFGDVVAKLDGGLPWPTTPHSSVGKAGEASARLAAAATAAAGSSTSSPSSMPPVPPPPRFGIVWVDFKAAAYKSSFLNDEPSIDLAGFHDEEGAPDYEPREKWLSYILERAEDPCGRVVVVILNRKHVQTVKDIRAFCAEGGNPPPKFVVCTRGRPEELAEWGIEPRLVTQDWVRAAQLAMEEVNKLR